MVACGARPGELETDSFAKVIPTFPSTTKSLLSALSTDLNGTITTVFSKWLFNCERQYHSMRNQKSRAFAGKFFCALESVSKNQLLPRLIPEITRTQLRGLALRVIQFSGFTRRYQWKEPVSVKQVLREARHFWCEPILLKVHQNLQCVSCSFGERTLFVGRSQTCVRLRRQTDFLKR